MRGRRAVVPVLLGLLAVANGCAGGTPELVDVPTTRAPAVVVTLPTSGRCPAGTVLLDDPDPASGAGALPDGFEGRRVLRCEVDLTTMTTTAGRDRLTVRQWEAPFTDELRSALALPDREYPETRGSNPACGSGVGGTTALYVVGAGGRAVRVLPPKDGPCHNVRPEVEALLPDARTPPRRTFTATRPAV